MEHKSPKWAPDLVMHHSKEFSDEFVKQIFRQIGAGRIGIIDTVVPDDARDFQRWKEISTERGAPWHLGFFFPVPHESGLTLDNAMLSFFPHAPTQRGLRNGRNVEYPFFKTHTTGWTFATMVATSLDISKPLHAQWCLSKLAPIVNLFEPDYAFCDTDVSVAKHIGSGPREKVWPVLVYGPEEVKEIGRERLLEAPAFRAQELSYGGIWLQVAENPFLAKRTELRAVAKHLGLEMSH